MNVSRTGPRSPQAHCEHRSEVELARQQMVDDPKVLLSCSSCRRTRVVRASETGS